MIFMKKYITHILAFVFFLFGYVHELAAAENILGISNAKLRKWDVDIDDIPVAIKSVTDFFMGIAGTIAVIFIIIGAYQILFWWLTGDRSKWRNTIIMALSWFALASLAWVIIKVIVNNLA